MPVATYIIATNPLPKHILENSINTSSAVYDTRFAFDYYHTLDQRIIWGGRIEMDKKRSPETISELLKQDLIKVFPQLKPHITVNYAWSGMMAYALHKMPIIGFTTPNLWHAFGFGGHGVAYIFD